MRYLILLLLVISQTLCAQSVTKVLIIDTLDYQDSVLVVQSINPIKSLFSRIESIDSLESIGYFLVDTCLVKSYRLKVNCHAVPSVIGLIQVENANTIFDLPLDDSGGHMAFIGLYNYPRDTISLSRHKVYHNCFTDTLKYSIGWYKKYNDGRPMKSLSWKEYSPLPMIKACNTAIPDMISGSINGRYFALVPTLRQARQVEISWYHGHKRMSRWRTKIYWKRRSNGKPYKYFAAKYLKHRYGLYAEMQL